MVNNFNSLLKTQRVEKRQRGSYTVRGNNVLIEKQVVSPKRKTQNYKNRDYKPSFLRMDIFENRNPEETAGKTGDNYQAPSGENEFFNETELGILLKENIAAKQQGRGLDFIQQVEPRTLSRAESGEASPAPQTSGFTPPPRREAGAAGSSGRVYTPYPASPLPGTAATGGRTVAVPLRRNTFTGTAAGIKTRLFPRAPELSPKHILIACAVLATGIFSYNALLWQHDEYLIQPPPEDGIRDEMLEFARTAPAPNMESKALSLPGVEPEAVQYEQKERDRIPVNTSDTFNWQNYIVRKGDSVSKIAAAHSLSMDAVIASNDMKNARSIREGDVLRIPNMDGIPYTAVSGDSFEKIAGQFGVPLDAILDANDIQTGTLSPGTQLFIPGARMKQSDLKLALGELFIYPVQGRLTSTFGWRKDPFTGQRRYHNAIDLAANTGAPVKAAMDGRVVTIGFSPVFGKYIIVSHNGGYQTLYAHLSKNTVTQGASVRQGDNIGEVGSTGQSTGPHLHFAIYKNNRAVNPLEFMKL